MQLGSPSRTALSVARQRAAHQLLEQPLIFADPLALRILGPSAASELRADLAPFTDRLSRGLRAAVVVRSRYAEDELARARREGIGQYIVLGAGLDTFACRNPHRELRVFEVDHPATQAWKREQLAAAQLVLPGSARLVAVDFECERAAAPLAAAGLDWRERCFISWLGVTVYLPREAVLATLAELAGVAASGSRIVFDYAIEPRLMSPEQRMGYELLAGRAAAVGEPWRSEFDPQALRGELVRLGYQDLEDLGAAQLNQRYFGARADGFVLRGTSRLLRAQRA